MKNNTSKFLILLCLLVSLIVPSTCIKFEKKMFVSTGAVSSISTNTAEASGMVIDLGNGATQHGHCYAIQPNVTIADSSTKLGVPPIGGFTSELARLSAGKKYYIKSYLSNGTETVYGKELNFTTVAVSLPTLTTTAITTITTTTAISGGNITSDGGATIIARGVCWNTSTVPSISNSKTMDGSGTGSFTSSLTNLTPGATYFVRAYATNSAGIAYGNEQTFTSVAAPTVPGAPTGVSAIAGNAQATVTFTAPASNGGSAITGYTVTTSPGGITGTGSASPITVTGLPGGTTYTFTVTATNANGTGPASSASISVIIPLTDRDGNVYNTVNIGTQVWMKENLKTTTYNYGTSILNVTDSAKWVGLSTDAYCWYNNDATMYKNTYGALYNWYAVNTGKLCPAGWHVPSDAEWKTLTDYLGGISVAGGKLKETTTIHWTTPNTGATNETGFTALPGGGRGDGAYYDVGYLGAWWSSTGTSTDAWTRNVGNSTTSVGRGLLSTQDGFSVRCVRDF